ncbi:unnamed protein product [Ilex paraguariensis]|uniref:Uncharacterized protein n=1 Tax=Ilex paraguariensis TaxID=185542 RepID=A0ABC8SSL7_9AQUA
MEPHATIPDSLVETATWDDNTNHLKFSYNGDDLFLPEDPLLVWNSPEKYLKVERIFSKNSVIVSITDVAEIAVNVVPVTKEDDRIHNYQFRFFGLSPEVEGVLDRTYQLDFENPAKPGVAMPVVGGEDKYRTTSLPSAECKSCVFSPSRITDQESDPVTIKYGMLDCASVFSHGNGIVCKK